jgi:death-on-curing protein
VIFLTPEQVLFIHSRVVRETGGSEGVRDLRLLLSAVNRPRAVFGGDDLYPDLFAKTAALLESLARNHAFVDGNKRTAAVCMGLCLKLNVYSLQALPDDLERFILQVAQGQSSLDDMTKWIGAHTRHARDNR